MAPPHNYLGDALESLHETTKGEHRWEALHRICGHDFQDLSIQPGPTHGVYESLEPLQSLRDSIYNLGDTFFSLKRKQAADKQKDPSGRQQAWGAHHDLQIQKICSCLEGLKGCFTSHVYSDTPAFIADLEIRAQELEREEKAFTDALFPRAPSSPCCYATNNTVTLVLGTTDVQSGYKIVKLTQPSSVDQVQNAHSQDTTSIHPRTVVDQEAREKILKALSSVQIPEIEEARQDPRVERAWLTFQNLVLGEEANASVTA